MGNQLEKRISRLERYWAEKKKERLVCNCRTETTFHSAPCLAALLNSIPRVCPVHGFRDLGFFCFASVKFPLVKEDNQFCPCPPHPWRSFVLSENRTWEGHEAARMAEYVPDPKYNFAENKARIEQLLAEYGEARQRRSTIGPANHSAT